MDGFASHIPTASAPNMGPAESIISRRDDQFQHQSVAIKAPAVSEEPRAFTMSGNMCVLQHEHQASCLEISMEKDLEGRAVAPLP